MTSGMWKGFACFLGGYRAPSAPTSKSNAKISIFLFALRGCATCQRCNGVPESPGTLPSVGMWGNLRCLDVHEQVSHARQFPHGPDVQLGRGDPLRDPQSRFSV